MIITKRQTAVATDESRDPWAVSDGLLYGLCRRYPDHHNAKAVTAKMLLIGRAYAATAERGRSKGAAAASSGDEFYIRDLPRALRTSDLDTRLAALRAHQRVTDDNVRAVVQAHQALMRVLGDLTGVEKRSLASKYLHFHLPRLFFIFDGRAQRMMRVVSPSVRRRRGADWAAGDSRYESFVSAALRLRGRLEARARRQLTPRHIDRVLLALERASRK
ncbi:MAG: hypothetical protein ABIX28_18315 [Vicinamibacterales bacterium]